MKRLITSVALLAIAFTPFVTAQASTPAEDTEAFRSYFKKAVPDVKFEDFQNGVYALDADSRSQWEEIEEFPPYEFAIELGQWPPAVEIWLLPHEFACG